MLRGIVVLEQMATMTLSQAIRHDDSTSPLTVHVFESVLQLLESLAVPLAKDLIFGFDMGRVCDVACAISVTCDGIEKGGNKQVRELEPHVIVTMPKCGHFPNPAIRVASDFEFLSEDGMCNRNILALVTAICDHESCVANAF